MSYFFNSLLKLFVKLTLQVYFKKWEICGLENIPKGIPVIFAANHQNAFLDALVVTCSSNRLPFYLARAEVFRHPIAARVLKFLRLMPIYRFRDGLANVKKNDEIIESCQAILQKGESLVMFPEGNHSERWSLRPLQRGLSRIAFKTEALSDFSLQLVIIPIGIQYEGPKSFRSRVLVQFGAPLKMINYKTEWEKNDRLALDVLKDDLHKVMKPLILNIPDEEYDKTLELYKNKRVYKKSMLDQLVADQKVIDTITKNTKEVAITPDKKPIVTLSWLFALPALLINILPYTITRWFIRKFVSDPVFTSSVKYAAGISLLPIYYALILCIAGFFLPSSALVWVALGLPLVTIFGLNGIQVLYRSRD